MPEGTAKSIASARSARKKKKYLVSERMEVVRTARKRSDANEAEGEVSTSIPSGEEVSHAATDAASSAGSSDCELFTGRRIVELGAIKARLAKGCHACERKLDFFLWCHGGTLCWFCK